MTTQYGTIYVDEKYSKIMEPNLYGDAILQPKKTFNDQYQGDANSGLVKIYKTTRDASSDPQTPAGDFNHENANNSLIDLRLNNAFRKSKKIYKIQSVAVPYALAEETLSTCVKDNQEDWHYSGLACLAYEGTALSDITAITTSNLKTQIIAARKALRAKHAKPDTVICSVDVYSLMLEVAGTQYTPSTNENTLTTGRVGMWLGMVWYEGDLLDNDAAKYYDFSGALRTVDLTDIDFIMYDHTAFHIVNNLQAMRLVDATDFVGTYAQNEINTGYRVSNADKVIVKNNETAPSVLTEIDVASVAGTVAVNDTVITIDPASPGSGYKYVYKLGTSYATVAYDQILTTGTGWVDLDSGDTVAAGTSTKITVCLVTVADSKARARGIATLVKKTE